MSPSHLAILNSGVPAWAWRLAKVWRMSYTHAMMALDRPSNEGFRTAHAPQNTHLGGIQV